MSQKVDGDIENERIGRETTMLKKEKEETMASSSSMVFSKVKIGGPVRAAQQMPLVSRSGASVNNSSRVSFILFHIFSLC